MSMGSDYASGYGLGLRQKEARFEQLESLRNRRPMGGSIKPGNYQSAEDIRAKAVEEALNRKAAELDIQKQEQDLREAVLTNAVNRDLTRAQTKGIEEDTYQQRMEGYDTRIGLAEERAEKATGLAATQSVATRKDALNDAMRGFYLGDTESVKQYFDRYGTAGVSIQEIERTPEGKIIVNFGENQSETFESAQDAIEKLLLPAETILRQQEKGLTTKEMSGIREDAIKQYSADIKNGVISDDIAKEEYIRNYINLVSGDQAAPGGFGLPEKGIPAPQGGEVARQTGPQKTVIKTQRNKKTGDIREIYSDGTIIEYDHQGNIKRQHVRQSINRQESPKGTIGNIPNKNYVEYKDAKTGELRRKAIQNGQVIEYRKDEQTGQWVLVTKGLKEE